MTKVLRAQNLVKKYGDFYAVNDIDLNLNKGEVVGLLGPNGAGKTTTFYMITGMIRPSSGKIIFGDKDITKSPMYKRARMGIGYLAQEPSIFGKLNVEDNLKIVLETIISSKEEQNNLIDKLLNEFNISHIRNNMGAGLSGGERRRVEICRTLALKPDFVLLDEPFAGVDPIAVEDIQQMIISLKQQNIGVLITDHNVRETLSITDRSYLLHGGKILKSGDAQTLASDEEVRRIYLGKNFKLDQ
jgi:lipopolysaccharide export system ATP-binding protein